MGPKAIGVNAMKENIKCKVNIFGSISCKYQYQRYRFKKFFYQQGQPNVFIPDTLNQESHFIYKNHM